MSDEVRRFDVYIVGGYWLAHDLLHLLSKEQLSYYLGCIEKELDKADESRLLLQIIENCKGVTYDKVKEAWQTITEVFRKYIEDEDN